MQRRRTRRSILARLRNRSPRYIAQYGALKLAHALDARELEFPLLAQDVADSQDLRSPTQPSMQTGAPQRVGWLAIPPGPGSGGHTTQFRMMETATEAGLENTLLLYDRHSGDFERNATVVRSAWPWLSADIRPVEGEIGGYDALVASSWPTAHVIAQRGVEGRRLYFIQDFEPFFLPRGAGYALAEDTYRFGFRNIALGHMVHDLLESEVGVSSDLVPFGCDTDVYRLLPGSGTRRGVVFYAKRGSDRRGYTLAVGALEIFHARHPEETIHVYGDTVSDLPFPTVTHGNVPPEALNVLYNSVVAGLALSFTNISLVAEEMLAAGVVPVVNDSPLARADLSNPHALWALATPRGIADGLSRALEHSSRGEGASGVAASVVGRSWQETGEKVAAIIREELADPRTATG